MALTYPELRDVVGGSFPGWDVINWEEDPVTYRNANIVPVEAKRHQDLFADTPQLVVVRQQTPTGVETRTLTVQNGRVTQIQTHPVSSVAAPRVHAWDYAAMLKETADRETLRRDSLSDEERTHEAGVAFSAPYRGAAAVVPGVIGPFGVATPAFPVAGPGGLRNLAGETPVVRPVV